MTTTIPTILLNSISNAQMVAENKETVYWFLLFQWLNHLFATWWYSEHESPISAERRDFTYFLYENIPVRRKRRRPKQRILGTRLSAIVRDVEIRRSNAFTYALKF